MAHRKHEEGKRKAFEERMARKAKREGKEAGYYLSIGADVPTVEDLALLRSLPKGEHEIIIMHSLTFSLTQYPFHLLAQYLTRLLALLAQYLTRFFTYSLRSPKEEAFAIWKQKYSQVGWLVRKDATNPQTFVTH